MNYSTFLISVVMIFKYWHAWRRIPRVTDDVSNKLFLVPSMQGFLLVTQWTQSELEQDFRNAD